MAIIIYCGIYILTTVLAIFPRAISGRFFVLSWFFVMVCLSLSSRLGFVYSPESDYGAYAMNMAITDYILPYHYREFVFWLGSRFLYGVLGDPNLVFVAMDLVLFIAFYNALKLLATIFDKDIDTANLRYLFFGAFLCLPYVIGFNNSYRQLLAICFFLNSLAYVRTKPKLSSAIFLISFFTHNVVAIMAPFLFLIKNKSNSYLFAFLAPVAISFVLIFVMSSDNEVLYRSGGVEIGKRIAWIYLFSLIFIAVIFSATEFYRSIRAKKKQSILGGILLFSTVMYFIGFMFLPSQTAERMFFAIFTVLYLLLGVYLESHFRTSFLVRLLYSQLASLPLLYLVI